MLTILYVLQDVLVMDEVDKLLDMGFEKRYIIIFRCFVLPNDYCNKLCCWNYIGI